jgi:hypothetical protein
MLLILSYLSAKIIIEEYKSVVSIFKEELFFKIQNAVKNNPGINIIYVLFFMCLCHYFNKFEWGY